MKKDSDKMAVVGMFDGVHLGHRSLISDLKNQASHRGLTPLVVTFFDHPLMAIDSARAPRLLSSPEEKCRMLEELGVEVAMLCFDERLRMTSAEDFLKMLAREYSVRSMLLGFNNRFGHDAPNDADTYRELAAGVGIELLLGKELKEGEEAVSSSRIRRAICEGKVEEASRLLGRNYGFYGTVVHGQALGRKLGFPTANVKPFSDRTLVPATGVYGARLTTADGEHHRAVVNVGCRPTLGEGLQTTVEAHLPDFDGDIYGENVALEFERWIREERKFEDLQSLKDQIMQDIFMA